MKRLIKFCQCFIKFFRKHDKTQGEQIPIEISPEEVILRGVVKPLFAGSKGLKEYVFLPPPKRARKDVSVLRLNYSNVNFCKSHFKSLNMGANLYSGIAAILPKHISEINNQTNLIFTNGEELSVSIEATPDYSSGLIMHADIIYSHSDSDEGLDDEPKTFLRKIAKELVKRAKYFEDPSPILSEWNGVEISGEVFNS